MYRDHSPSCPRCDVSLARSLDARESWGCGSCGGSLVATGELVRGILEIEPGLLPEAGVKGLHTIGRATTEPALRCGVCARPMEPVFLGGAELDRCYTDELIWLDDHEHERVLASARAQRQSSDASWVRRVLAWLRSDER